MTTPVEKIIIKYYIILVIVLVQVGISGMLIC